MDDQTRINLEFFRPEEKDGGNVPLAQSSVAAGFPSPADDFLESALDLNKALVRHPSATFYARVDGDSMRDACIESGDLLVIDKAVQPYDGCVAVAYIDGDFTLKRIKMDGNSVWLMPANTKYQPIRINEDNNFSVWGVVQYVIKKI